MNLCCGFINLEYQSNDLYIRRTTFNGNVTPLHMCVKNLDEMSVSVWTFDLDILISNLFLFIFCNLLTY